MFPKRLFFREKAAIKSCVSFCRIGLCLLLTISVSARGDDAAVPTPEPTKQPTTAPEKKPVTSTLEMQVELHRRGFSCGSIDGIAGGQTVAALKAFQRSEGLEDTGRLDAPTRERLLLNGPALSSYTFTAVDLGGLRPVPATWLEKSQMSNLGYATALELVSERYHARPTFVKQLNPGVNWAAMLPGTKVTVPAADQVTIDGTADKIVIFLADRELNVIDATGKTVAHFPVSIARMAEKRPVGDLHVVVVILDPDYTFDPDVFPESPEAKTLGRKLVIPPGPNNPVGVAWIGLDRTGYGIHGTPEPEQVGRTESHGCFRLANWDVQTLVGLVHVGMVVTVAE